MSVGAFDYSLLTAPVNIGLGIMMISSLLFASFWSDSTLFRWFSGVPFAVCTLAALLLLTIVMGLTPQAETVDPTRVISLLGFDRMTHTWYFVLIYTICLFSLGAVIVRRLKRFSIRSIGFYLNHIGLWIFIFAAGLGAADVRRYVLHAEEGADTPEWRVYSEEGDVLELPLAIRLNDFIMEEYAPKLAIIERATGEALPIGDPFYFQLDPRRPKERIVDWDIVVEQYIQEAIRSSDSSYREVPMPGSCPAALVRATHTTTGKTARGWVCSGNQSQLYMVMNLSDDHCMVMTTPEAKRYASDIVVYTETGKTIPYVLEVNKPLSVDNWTIYQYSYDTERGKASTVSSFELVYDPWLKLVYLGIMLFAAGCVCMFWQGNEK